MASMKISACEIYNECDTKYYTLYVEWLDSSHFTVLLMEPSMPPLCGKMDTKNVNYFCEELSKSSTEYLEETEKILCGKDQEIRFFIKNTALEWKRGVWILGRIELHSDLDVTIILEHFQRSLKFYRNIQDKLSVLEEENKNLMDVKKKLCSDIEKMIEVKNSVEQDMYKKFILILNSKKAKLRELKNSIKMKQDTKDSVFAVCTDESSESDEENNKTNSRCTIDTTFGKRKSIDNNNSTSTQKVRRTYSTVNKDFIIKQEISDIAFTAKDSMNNTKGKSNNCAAEENKIKATNEQQGSTSETRKSSSRLNFIEDESDEELFS
ncbi:DNA repair protein XRCC4-like [Hylaeus anthracinus]|uniref:DNA repair protein XRCC4-like n=1 Tax=Hylaeus anthracinus TaxID=313031 RepID=UPI0023B900EA|nr:DNA repair protein XRCC4-like [Hylaeus anthracinus]